MSISQQDLKHLIRYESNTGKFFRVIPSGREKNKDGSLNRKHGKKKLFSITLNGTTYVAARLAWLYMTGSFPARGSIVSFRDGNSFNLK